MSLLPRTTLHGDSEQFIYNWMLEDDPDLDRGYWRKLNGKAGQRKKGVMQTSRDVDSRNPAVMLNQGSAERRHGTKRA
jgi:hypothetical protein